MFRAAIAAIVVTSLSLPALGQQARSYVGVVKGERVRVRTGPGLNHYEMLRLSSPARVNVVGRSADGAWLEILPPDGAYAVIARQFVSVDGSTGTVTGDRVNVRAGSDYDAHALDAVLTQLGKGQTVRIVAQTEEYYRILPPPGVTVFISADYVEPAPGQTLPEPATRATPATGQSPATRPTPATGGVATRPVTPPRPAVDAELFKAFQAAEDALETEYAKPSAQRDIPGLLNVYRALDVPSDSQLKPFVDYRVRFLELTIARAAAVEGARDQIDRVLAQQIRDEAMRAKYEITVTRPQPGYAAQGRLRASELFDGRGAIPRRWAVYDVQTGQITAWAQATPGVDLSEHEGQIVALIGPRTYNPRLKAYIVDVESVKRIDAPAPVPADSAAPPVQADTQAAPTSSLQPELIPSGMRVYVVKEGDRDFWQIARDQYGDGAHWEQVRDANPDANPRQLQPGQILMLPERTSVGGSTRPAITSASAEAATLEIVPTTRATSSPVDASEYE